MLIIIFDNSSFSAEKGNKIDTSLFVQKRFLRTKIFESKIEENTEMKKQFEIKNSPDLLENTVAICKSYTDSGLSDLSIIRNNAQITFNEKNLENVGLVKVYSLSTVSQHLTPKWYVEDAIDEITLVKADRNSYFDNNELSNLS